MRPASIRSRLRRRLPSAPRAGSRPGRGLVALLATLGLAVSVWASLSIITDTPAAAVEGGEEVPFDDAPDWAVFVRSADGEGRGGACSGSLIAADAVLTAAHCLFDDDGERTPDHELAVLVGRPDLGDLSRGVARRVGASHLHPGYVWSPRLAPHDLAVIRIEPVPSHYRVVPLARSVPPVLIEPVILGYGATSADGPHSTVLRRTPSGAYFGDDCLTSAQGSPFVACLHPRRDGVDIRPGDSGAPIVVRERGSWVQYLVLNSVTEAERVGLGATVGASTDDTDHRRWIVETAGLIDPAPGSVLVDDGGRTWSVTDQGRRTRIPDDAVAACLASRGRAPMTLSVQQVQQLPEVVGVEAQCPVAPGSDPDPTPGTDGSRSDGDSCSVVVGPDADPETLLRALALLLHQLLDRYPSAADDPTATNPHPCAPSTTD